MRRNYLLLLLVCFSLVVVQSVAQTTFNYTGSMQTYGVPSGCTSISVDLAGGEGGTYPSHGVGGLGGRTQATIAVTPGQTLYLYVGQKGVSSNGGSGGTNSGGGGQGGNGSATSGGAGGGGSTDIRTTSGVLSSRLVVAGGGGGGAWECGSGNGGAGGGLTGGNGTSACAGGYSTTYSGTPGSQTSGGSGGSGATSGGLGYGGNGATWGAGGGGGYYGAGGAFRAGACGGSSYYGGTGVTDGTTTTDFRTGNGYVVVTPLTPLLDASPSSIDFGGVVVDGHSEPQSFEVSGTALDGYPGDITVTAPTDFQVSIEGTLWFTSLTIPFTSGVLSPATIFVRFNPTSLGAVSDDITIEGGGAVATTVTLSGTGANVCTGIPTPGTASISPSSGGSGATFTLSLSGTTAAGGLSYQWQSSTTGTAGSFTDISGANTPGFSFSGLSSSTYYQCEVTCPTFTSATSNTVTATYVAPTYCTPSYSNASSSCSSYSMYSRIGNLVGYAGTISDATSCNSTGYLDKTALSCTLLSGSSYTATIQTGYSCCMNSQLFIDFNGDGTFSSGETVGGVSSQYSSPGTTYSVNIPEGAAPGTFRMRLSGNYAGCCGGSTYPGIPGCITPSTTYGETRDYTVTIVPPCATPASLTGINYVCFPGTTTLESATTGGTWTSGNTDVATVSSAGVVTGLSAGAAVMTYTVAGGCKTTRVVGVYGKPSVSGITASTSTVCANSAINLTSGSTSGPVVAYNWSGPDGYSTSTTINTTSHTPTSTAGSGSYSLVVTSTAGCASDPVSTASITVLTSPDAFTGMHATCEDATTTLGNAVGGGAWTSGSSAVATIDPGTGTLTGVSSGLTNITYTLPNTCYSFEVVSVNPLPVVSITPPGPTTICMGESTPFTAISPDPTFALLSQNFDGGLSGWSFENLAGVTASYFQIVTPPGVDGTAGDGSPMMQSASSLTSGFTHSRLISPSFSTEGYGSATLKFNQYLISTVPDVHALVQYSIDGGATWSDLLEQVNGFSGTGVWDAGSPQVTMMLPADAIDVADVRLRFDYEASSFYWFLDNISVIAALPASTFAWTGDLGLSCTTCTNPDITPTSVGANEYSVTVTSSAGCTTTNEVVVNVNPLPGSITGNLSVCVGSTFMLGNSSPGGTWSSSDLSKAMISATTGAITGLSTGTTNITYTLPTNCYMVAVATVNAAPASIGGADNVCEGQTTTLTHIIGGGSWASSSTTNASINSFGTVSGIMDGNTIVTYTLPSGCTVWKSMTVNATPAAITGTAVVCEGAVTNLSNTSGGGFWTSGAATVATINSLGTVTGIAEGNSIITYSLPTGCSAQRIVTVNGLPAPIGGATNVCQGSMAVVTNATAGGTWSISNPTMAIINASGIITGVSQGTVAVSYIITSTGCGVSIPFTVNQLPNDIAGLNEVCVSDLIAKVSSPSGGTWTSSGPSTLAIDPSTGVATGMSGGVATVTYTLATGCRKTAAVTVNELPVPISGTFELCMGQTATVFDFTPGGGWATGNASIAAISPTGVISGVSAGMAQISYTLGTGCLQTQIVTVDPLPGAITGSFQVCQGQTTTLVNPDMGGSWTSGNGSIATISSLGVLTGISAGNVIISYALSTGCYVTQMVTVNALPGTITGPSSVCAGSTITLGNAITGGSWTPEAASIATVDAFGVVTGMGDGTTIITYTLPTGCSRVKSIVVNVAPDPIAGNLQVCTGLTSTLSGTPSGGVWTSGSSAIAPIDAAGTVTGATAGTSMISYTLSTGCRSTASFLVNPLPAVVTGVMNVCVGGTTTLSSTSTGGTWGVTMPFNGSIEMMTGVLTGLNAGTTTVIYTLPTSCTRTATVLVNSLPAPIFGVLNVCAGFSTTLTDATSGGMWTSSLPSIASITSSGLVIGNSAGISNVTYTLPTGCYATASAVVNAIPADITGTAVVCVGDNTLLSNATSGGNWLSDNPAIASVDAAGMVTGNTAGSATIRYYLPTGCEKSVNVVVNALPASITGSTSICQSAGTLLSSTSVGGTWISSDPSVAPIGIATGIATGASVGFSIITYTMPTGCKTTASLIVNGLPEVITGTTTVCANKTTLLENATGGGTWSSSSSVAMIDAAGMVTGIAAGTARITYTIGNTCRRSIIVTVNALPGLISGGGSVCPGLTAVYANPVPGGMWTSDNSTIASVDATTGVISGVATGDAIITYTLPTGCMRAKAVIVHPAVEPIAGIMEVCPGDISILSDATMGGIWISGNTTIATINSTTGELTGVASGNAQITYSLPTGCMATAMMVVNPMPSNITGIMNVCEGSSTMLTNGTTGGMWSSSDMITADVDDTGSVSGMVPGAATITYTLPTGCYKAKEVIVNALPAAKAVTGGGSYCEGGTGVVIGLDGSETGTVYHLSSGSSSIASIPGTGAAITFGMQEGTGSYNVTATSVMGCTNSMTGTATISVNPLIAPMVTMTSDMADTICDGAVATFTAIGLDGGATPMFTWSVDGVEVSTGSTYSYMPANGDMVSVVITSSELCVSPAYASAMKFITVLPNLAPSISIMAASGDTLCQGESATFIASDVNGGALPVYTWIVSGSIVPDAADAVYSFVPTSGQSVTCRLNSSYRCPTINNVSSNLVTMHVEPKYIPVATIIAEPGTVVEEGQTVNFTTTVTGGGPTPRYQWLIRGVAVPGATATTFSSNDFSNGDSVTCVVYGSGACGLATVNSVVLEILPPTGVNTIVRRESDLRLVPNPSHGNFIISGEIPGNNGGVVTIEVANMLGQVVLHTNGKIENGAIEEHLVLDSQSNGMYLVRVLSKGVNKTFHLIVY